MSYHHRPRRLATVVPAVATILALAAALVHPAQAETSPVIVDGAQLSAPLRGEYLAGDQVVVAVTVSNPGESSVTFADLAARPWLIRFEQVLADGRKLRRSTAEPEQDEGRTVRIPVRGQRRTLLEIPGAEATAAGSYELAVQLVVGEQVTDITRQAVAFAPPRLVAGDLGPEGLAGTKVGLQAVWVHQAGQGFDLYLHQASSQDPTRAGSNRHLVHLDSMIRPYLAAARTTEATAPVVVWAEGGRTLRIVRVDSTGLLTTDRSVDAPWPAVEILGRPGVASGGAVGVPLWVPDPAGDGGELRVATVGPGSFAGFAKLSRLASRPAQVQTTVDASGSVQLLVRHSAGLDLYTLGGSSVVGGEVLPLPGRRLLAPQPDAPLLGASFGVAEQSAEHAGGLSVFTLSRAEGGLQGRWLDLQGNAVRDLAVVPEPAGDLVGFLPGATGVGLLTRSGSTMRWTEGADVQALKGIAGDVELVRDASGRAILRHLASAGAPVVAQLLGSAPAVADPAVVDPAAADPAAP